MSFVYFDTCALMRHAQGLKSESGKRDTEGRREVERILSSDARLAVSEIGIIEFHDALGKRVRDDNQAHFDDPWMDQSLGELFEHVRVGRVEVVSVPRRAVENALGLMLTAHWRERIAFNAWDAVHAIVATAWSREVGSTVEIATCDRDFPRFFDRYPLFAPWVKVRWVTPVASSDV